METIAFLVNTNRTMGITYDSELRRFVFDFVIDDVATSGSTLNEILRTLRILNEDNAITIFSLIGRKDLMADVF